MADIKTRAQGLDPNARARNIKEVVGGNKSIYESLAIIARRSNQIAIDLKHELNSKLEEFAVSSETIEEVTENKEQIEISKFYEKLPNPAIIATEEFLEGETHHDYRKAKKRF